MVPNTITSTTQINLDPGVYSNVFPVFFAEDDVELFIAPRATYQDLRPLRKRISDEEWNIQVYAPAESVHVYGYGPDAAHLQLLGFEGEVVQLSDVPRLATRLICDGMSALLHDEGCEIQFRKGHVQVYRTDIVKSAASGKIRVYRGYDLRSSFWFDPVEGTLAFGLVVDVTWALRDSSGQSVDMRQVGQLQAAREIAQLQGEYLPGSARINTEVARQRLKDYVIPFVRRHPQFQLPCGTPVELCPQPVRVILGGYEA